MAFDATLCAAETLSRHSPHKPAAFVAISWFLRILRSVYLLRSIVLKKRVHSQNKYEEHSMTSKKLIVYRRVKHCKFVRSRGANWVNQCLNCFLIHVEFLNQIRK